MKLNKMFKKNYIKQNHERIVYYIIICSALLKSLMFIFKPNIWWDSAEYIGIGKYIWSFGEIGFWNPVRPLLFPVYLGFIDKLGLDPVFFGRVLQIIASSISVYLVYKIALKLFYDHKIALFSAIFLAFDSIIFQNTLELYTSTIAMCFSLLAVYYYLRFNEEKTKNSYYLILIGVFAGLAFLTRFTFLLIIAAIFLSLVSLDIKNIRLKIKYLIIIAVSYAIIILPFFILNFFKYNNILYPLFRGSYEINLCGDSILYPVMFFLTDLPKSSIIIIFSLVGIYYALKKPNDDGYVLLMLLIFLPFLYHTFIVPVKVIRYSIIFMPFLYILTSHGIVKLMHKKNKLLRSLIILIIAISLLYSLILSLSYLVQNQNQNYLEDNYYNYFSDDKYYGEMVMLSSPYPLMHSDIRVNSTFFPKMTEIRYYEDNYDVFYVMISKAYNLCDRNLTECRIIKDETDKTFDYINQNYNLLYNTTVYGETYYIFKNN